jgi:hypothetical protein
MPGPLIATEEPQRRLLGCVRFLPLVLMTSVAQAQSPEQRAIAAYTDCTVAAFRERVDQVNDPNLLAEMSLAACPTEEAALLAWCMSSEHFGQLAWQFKRMSGSSGLRVQAAIAC